MRILFQKNDPSVDVEKHTFQGLGISECYVKDLNVSADKATTLRTVHHHAFYEVHIIRAGSQEYEIANEKITVSEGELLFIPPYVPHLVVSETDDYKKCAVNFTLSEDSRLLPKISHLPSYVVAEASAEFLSVLDFLSGENLNPSAFSEHMAELSALECVLFVLRLVGARDESERRPAPLNDTRLAMAKQFIRDNVQAGFTIRELAAYCYIGEKQLSRIFYREEKCTVAEYIRAERLKHIKTLLASGYSVRQISEMMNFSSEYYLNSFFKKHVGIAPGAYRKENKKEQG
jgi:AraC-like DNA-binding protein